MAKIVSAYLVVFSPVVWLWLFVSTAEKIKRIHIKYIPLVLTGMGCGYLALAPGSGKQPLPPFVPEVKTVKQKAQLTPKSSLEQNSKTELHKYIAWVWSNSIFDMTAIKVCWPECTPHFSLCRHSCFYVRTKWGRTVFGFSLHCLLYLNRTPNCFLALLFFYSLVIWLG